MRETWKHNGVIDFMESRSGHVDFGMDAFQKLLVGRRHRVSALHVVEETFRRGPIFQDSDLAIRE